MKHYGIVLFVGMLVGCTAPQRNVLVNPRTGHAVECPARPSGLDAFAAGLRVWGQDFKDRHVRMPENGLTE